MVYVLTYLLCGTFPWVQNMGTCQKKTTLSAVLTYKHTIAFKQLCSEHNFPELSNMLLYIHMLSFEEPPDYLFLCYLLWATTSQSLNEMKSIQLIKDNLHQAHPSHAVFTSHSCSHTPPAQLSEIQESHAILVQVQKQQAAADTDYLDNPMIVSHKFCLLYRCTWLTEHSQQCHFMTELVQLGLGDSLMCICTCRQ